jgi:hypothetical protein
MNLSHERFIRVLASLKTDDGVAIENRHHPRVPLRSSILMAPCDNGQLGPALTVRLQDVSSGGASLHAFHPMTVGQQFVIELPENNTDAEESPAMLRILVRVAHCKQIAEHQYLAGLQFVRLWTAPAPSLDAARAAA